MKIIRLYIVFLLLILTSNAFSQDDPLPVPVTPQPTDETGPVKKQYYLLSPRVSVTVPHPMGNKSFKKSFVGIYEVSAGLNFMLHKGLFVGLSELLNRYKSFENIFGNRQRT